MSPLSMSHAKSLIRELPSRPKNVLENPKYWDLTFARLYLDHCDDVLFDNPRLGLELAKIAPELVLRIPKKNGEAWKYVDDDEKRQHRELLVRSFAVLGGGYRTSGRLKHAETTYRAAVRHAESGPICPPVRANLDKRLAKLRSNQGRFGEALELLDGAIETYRGTDELSYADALNTKGYVLGEAGRVSEAVPYFGRALSLAKGKRRERKLAELTVFTATHNLAAAVLTGCSSQDLVDVLPLVKEAKRYQGRRRNGVSQQKLAWVEARIHAKFGCGRTAQRRLNVAHRKLIGLGAPFEAALVALELATLHWQWREWGELEELACETFEVFQALSSHTEAVAALRLWVEGSRMRSLTEEDLRKAQATMEAEIFRQERGR